MGTESTDFELWLKSRFDGDALKAAQAEFKRTQRAAEETGEGMSAMGKAGAELKKQLAELFVIAEVLKQLKEGFAEVTAEEQAMNRLADAAARFGGNAADLDEQFKHLAKTIQDKSGLDDDALYLHMVKVYQATGNMTEAMGQAALAADVARGANIPLEQALGIVNAAALGNTRALRELGISVATTGDKSKDAKAALKALQKTFHGAAESAKGTTVEMGKLKEEWSDIRKSFVEGGGELLSTLLKVINVGLQPFFLMWQMGGNTIATVTKGIGGFATSIWKLFQGDFKGAKEGALATWGDLQKGLEKSFDILVERAEKTWDIVTGRSSSIASYQPKGTGPEKERKDKDGKPQLSHEVEIAQWNAEQIAKLQAKMFEQRLEAEKKFEDAKEKLRIHGQKEDKRIDDEITKNREAAMHARTRLILEEVKTQKAAEKAKEQAALAATSAVIGAMQDAFGESKALAIADAVINTWAGAARALKDWPAPYSYVIMAATIASGLAQVAKIQSTNPTTQGQGFDDPSNDAAARMGGRRWAADMIGEFTRGVSSGWSEGMGRGVANNTTYNQQRTTNVHLHGVSFLDPSNVQQVKQFKRTLDVVDKSIDQQRTLARVGR